MFAFRVTTPDRQRILIQINVKSQTEIGDLKLSSGNAAALFKFRELLDVGYGAFGHPIDSESASPEDIHAFLTGLKGYRFEITQGEISEYEFADEENGEIY